MVPGETPDIDAATENVEWEDPSTLPVEAVRDLFMTLSKALRSYQLYDRNNPVYRRFLENLREALAGVWQDRPTLQILVEEDRFLWVGEEVYRDENRSGSLPFVFYRDGIRDLVLREGIEGEEVEVLLDILHRVRSARQEEDDLVTLLWDLDLEYLEYSAVDLLPEGTLLRSEGAPDPSELDVRDILEGELGEDVAVDDEDGLSSADSSVLDELRAVNLEDFNPALYALDESARSYLRDELQTELERDHAMDVLAALFDRLEDPKAARQRQEEIVEVLQQLLPTFLARGKLKHAARLLGELEQIRSRVQDLAPSAVSGIDQLLEEFSSPDSVRELVQAVEDGAVSDDGDSLALLLRHLRPTALGPLLARAEEVSRPEARQSIQLAIRKLAEGEEERLLRFLAHSDDTVVTGAVRLMGALRHRPAVPTLIRLLNEGSQEVRLAVLEAARRIPTTPMAEAVEGCLDSSSRDLRILAARVLADIQYTPAIPHFLRILDGKDIRSADLTEMMALFQAYASVAGEDAIGYLDRIVHRRGFLGRREPGELRACAVLALGTVGSSRALESVRRAGEDDEAVVRSAVKRALSGAEEGQDD